MPKPGSDSAAGPGDSRVRPDVRCAYPACKAPEESGLESSRTHSIDNFLPQGRRRADHRDLDQATTHGPDTRSYPPSTADTNQMVRADSLMRAAWDRTNPQ